MVFRRENGDGSNEGKRKTARSFNSCAGSCTFLTSEYG